MNELMITQAQHLQQSLFDDLLPLLNIHPAAFLSVFFFALYLASLTCESLSRQLENRWLLRNVFRSSDILCFLWMLLESSRYASAIVFVSFRAYGYPWTIPAFMFHPAILALIYIPHLTSLFRLFAFAYPNTTVRWGRHRYGKMAINILQRYYTVELIWMKYIAPIYAGMAIYFTWVDHGRPNVWQLPQFFQLFDYRFIPSLGDL
ncbi:hypothetical protein NliqN6_0212 [Naganishia liquefaciens]|uniref:Uncharacterized protein n=1 Tax=Naganishia liquefaciens TaxID=104408 RepID=A0A8H3TMH7_9TREE|nr:hypothetical protein NliqN6_0212 [Naganishia liquefaciens]